MPLTMATAPGGWTWSSSWAAAIPDSPYVDQADLAAARLLLETGQPDRAHSYLTAVMGHST